MLAFVWRRLFLWSSRALVNGRRWFSLRCYGVVGIALRARKR